MPETTRNQNAGTLSATLGGQLLEECRCMVGFALSSGKQLPDTIVPQLLQAEKALRDYEAAIDDSGGSDSAIAAIANLVTIHNKLAAVVAPAAPRAIVILQEAARKPAHVRLFGSVAIIRHMMLIAGVSLVGFIALSLSPRLDEAIQSHDILLDLDGIHLLIILLFLLSAASIGAAFDSLFRANRYIEKGTFDPRYESSYWIRFGLGLLSGMLLATLIPLSPELTLMGRPTLAMIGGFSSDLLYQIIKRLIDAIESIFKGNVAEMLKAREITLQTEYSAKELDLKQSMIQQWLQLRDEVSKNGDTDKRMLELIDDSIAQLRQ